MIIASATRHRYDAIKDHLAFVQLAVRETLATYANPRGWAVLVRTKELDSLSEKIETGRFRNWTELNDLVAATLVVPTLAEEAEALSFLRKSFDEVETNLRGSSMKAPDAFRFDNTRFTGLLPRPEDIDPSEPVYSLRFEVQVRTAFEHAWSVATHSLTYKSGEISWERARLAAQLKASVEQLDLLIISFEDTSKKIFTSTWPEIDAKVSLVAFFKGRFEDGSIPVELRPKDWTRFSDNVYSMVRSASNTWKLKPKELADLVISGIGGELDSKVHEVPMSISLVQYIFGTLFTAGLVKKPFKRYFPLITTELEDLFAITRGFEERFDYEATESTGPVDTA